MCRWTDFTRLLGPSGLIDTFFNDNLKPLVDTSQTPWRWQSADHAQLGLSQGTLIQFQRAAAIRDALFAGGSQIMVKFSLVPLSLDAKVGKISLDIAGQNDDIRSRPDGIPELHLAGGERQDIGAGDDDGGDRWEGNRGGKGWPVVVAATVGHRTGYPKRPARQFQTGVQLAFRQCNLHAECEQCSQSLYNGRDAGFPLPGKTLRKRCRMMDFPRTRQHCFGPHGRSERLDEA